MDHLTDFFEQYRVGNLDVMDLQSSCFAVGKDLLQ
jgi:hypothetical protein